MRSLPALIVLFFTLTQSVAAREIEGQVRLRDLPAGKAVLAYERIDQTRLAVAVITNGGVKEVPLIAPEFDVRHLANQLLDNLSPDRVVIASTDDLPDFDAETAHRLFMLLVDPLMDELGGIDRLAIAADGMLADLPFDTLLTDLPSAQLRHGRTFSAFPWLRKRFAISRLTGRARPVSDNVAISRTSGGLLGFGNPTVGQERGLSLPALPEANLELALLRMSLHGRPSNIAIGAKASETRFKEMLASSGGLAVLALATHGLWDQSVENDAVLMLSEGDGEDGILTAAEVRALRFRADLVILSACNSGAGPLVDAFIEAGGEQVLALRWQVLSEVARQISADVVKMTQRDDALSYDLALWQSVDRLINGGASPHYGHPMIWGPFVLTAATA